MLGRGRYVQLRAVVLSVPRFSAAVIIYRAYPCRLLRVRRLPQMASLTRITFDREGLWTMLGSFSVGAGVAVHSLWNPAFYLGFGLRSVGLVRAVGVFLVIVGWWYVVRPLWMLADRLGAIEFGEDSLVVRAAGPPVRQIAWLDVQGATASKHHVSIRRTTGK